VEQVRLSERVYIFVHLSRLVLLDILQNFVESGYTEPMTDLGDFDQVDFPGNVDEHGLAAAPVLSRFGYKQSQADDLVIFHSK